MSEPTSPAKTQQTPWTVILAFAVPVVVVVLAVVFVAAGRKGGAGDGLTDEAIEQRIAPVAGFKFADSAGASKDPRTGEALYKTACIACHGTGVAGAPKTGDAAAWGPRIARGYDDVLKVALAGKGAMPPKGGVADASDFEFARAVVYLANQAGAKFKEPEPPKGAAK